MDQRKEMDMERERKINNGTEEKSLPFLSHHFFPLLIWCRNEGAKRMGKEEGHDYGHHHQEKGFEEGEMKKQEQLEWTMNVTLDMMILLGAVEVLLGSVKVMMDSKNQCWTTWTIFLPLHLVSIRCPLQRMWRRRSWWWWRKGSMDMKWGLEVVLKDMIIIIMSLSG